MQKIFDQLPGMQLSAQASGPNGPVKMNINPGFAGLEQALNGVKGYMFDKGINPPSSYFQRSRLATTQSKIDTIQDFIMLFGVIRDPDFQRMFDVTNNRMYQAYAGVDYLITTNTLKKADGSPLPATWASDYKTWMTQYLADIATPAWTWASTTRDDLETQLNADTTMDPTVKAAQLKLLANIKTAPGFSQSSFTCDFGLTWQAGRLNIRDLDGIHLLAERGGSCQYNSQSLSSSIQATSPDVRSASTLAPPVMNSASQASRGHGGSNVASATGLISTPASVLFHSITSTPGVGSGSSGAHRPSSTTVVASMPNLSCMYDGAPWYSPTSWCDCPSATFAALPVASSVTGDQSRSAMCAYTSLDPAKTIKPVQTSAAPTNIPGMGGVPGCRGVIFSPDSACPYAANGYCDCGGVQVPSLSNDTIINCDYKLQPTARDCPVVTSFSMSIAASSASAASVASVSSASVASVISASKASVAAAGPTETSYNNGGSAICGDINRKACQTAFSQYNDANVYTQYSSYVASAGNTAINVIFGPFANQGCTAKFSCDSDAAYAKGMTGQQIKAAFNQLYTHSDVSICGTSDLSNGCRVSVDACNDCLPVIPCQALSPSDVQSGFPCYGQFADGLARTCKYRPIGCGRAGICGHQCSCTDGSSPSAFVEPNTHLYTCPDVAGLPNPPPGWPFH